MLEKYMFVSHIKHTQLKINGCTSFATDNMYYISLKFKNKWAYLGAVKLKNKRLEVLENTFNLHSNSI